MRKIKSTKIEPKTVFYQTNGTGTKLKLIKRKGYVYIN